MNSVNLAEVDCIDQTMTNVFSSLGPETEEVIISQ